MILEGTQTLNTDVQTVWSALFDRMILEQSIPGCESLEQSSDTQFTAITKLKIGPVSARFKGDVEISDIIEGKSCTLSGKGSGGVAGFAKGLAKVELIEEGEATVLVYSADVAIGGKLAALGNRLIKSTAQKLTDEFFVSFSNALAGRQDSKAASSSQTTGHEISN